jgi:hypothetical protein
MIDANSSLSVLTCDKAFAARHSSMRRRGRSGRPLSANIVGQKPPVTVRLLSKNVTETDLDDVGLRPMTMWVTQSCFQPSSFPSLSLSLVPTNYARGRSRPAAVASG